jgi:hypothetical protein
MQSPRRAASPTCPKDDEARTVMHTPCRVISAFAVSALLLLASLAEAQSAAGRASISGIVRDTSGAVLPGVTVEASSASLIEKTRAQTSDDGGRYRVVDLPAGTYEVTFTLPGFSTVRRQGILLEGAFAATINIEMGIGQVSEVVTVSGESPIVDIQNAQQQVVINRDALTQLPIARDWFSVASLVPQMVTSGTQDVGGLNGTRAIVMNFSDNGGRGTEGRLQVDGLSTGGNRTNGTGSGVFLPDITNAQEVIVVASGGLGSAEAGGPVINVIPRSGGNTPSGSFYYNFSNDSLQGNNITRELREQNPALASAAGNILKTQDINGAFGGPIKKDRIWYFGGLRHTILDKQIQSFFYNRNQNVNIASGTINGIRFNMPAPYEPDLSQPALDDTRQKEGNIRITTQLTARNKLTVAYTQQYRLIDYKGGAPPTGTTFISPEATPTSNARPQRLTQVTWQNVWSNRLLFEASGSKYTLASGGLLRDDNDTSVLRVTDAAAVIPALSATPVNITYGSQSSLANSFAYSRNSYHVERWRASASYVHGGHNLRVGHDGTYFGHFNRAFTNDAGLAYGLRNGVAQTVTVTAVSGFSTPGPAKGWVKNLAGYVEDQWTLGRLTLQGAARFDYAESGHPEQTYGPSNVAVNLQPTRIVFPAGKSVWGYKDITPRMGATVDLFGTGKTALKFNAGKYVAATELNGIWAQNNPTVAALTNQYTRNWIDTNGNWTVDCDLTNPDLQGTPGTQPFGATAGTVAAGNASVDQCQAPAGGIPTFGSGLNTTTPDPGLLGGWNTRPNDWQIGIGVQHEVLPRMSVEVAYRRRWLGNFSFTNNYGTGPGCGPGQTDCLTPESYTRYSVVAPLDPRLPGGGGYLVEGLYDLNSATIGTQNLISLADDAHRATSVYNGIDYNVTVRLREGLTIRGGWVNSRTIDDTCRQAVDNPEALRGCRIERPWVYQARGLASYITPQSFGWLRDLNVSGTFNSIPVTVASAANYQIPNTLIRDGYCVGSVCSQGLGRLPTNGQLTGFTTKNLLDPNHPTYIDQQLNADLHVGRIVRFGRSRANLGVDVYNFLNFSSVLTRNYTLIYPNAPVASAFQQPITVGAARFLKFTVQYDF